VTRNGTASTPDGKAHRLNNGDVVTVRFTPGGDLIDARGWVVPASFGHLAHGVVTSHASQGTEAAVVFVAQSGVSRGAASAEQLYVSAGRGEKALRLYTDDKDALRAAVARSDRARSAGEVRQAQQRQRQAEDRAAREHRARRRQRRRGWWAAARAARDRLAAKVWEAAAAPRERRESRGPGHAQP
jgi:hypothetical protein